jgi:F-type H+-transporting ATPase subunit delta
MFAQQVAKKYSTALFELAREKNLIDSTWDQFNMLGEYVNKDRTFLDFMAAPQVCDVKKYGLIKTAFSGKLDKPLYDFLMFLARKRRIKYLPDIIEYFDDLVRESKSIARVTCITALPISESERQRVIEKLQAKTSLKIELEEKIDTSIIGGMIIMLHNQIIDGSIRQDLIELKNRLMKVKVH